MFLPLAATAIKTLVMAAMPELKALTLAAPVISFTFLS